MATYSASDITVLSREEAIRRRPGMFFGGVEHGGKHQLAWELIGNALDQVLRRNATQIDISIEGEHLVVSDDGVGISPEQLEAAFTTVHAGTRRPPKPHVHISPSLRGLGVGPVNFVSEQFLVESFFQGRRYVIRFERGRTKTAVRDVGATDRSGLRVALVADPEIFSHVGWDIPLIRDRVATLACLNPTATLVFNGELYQSPDGLSALIPGSGEAIVLRGRHAKVEVEVAMRWRPNQPLVLGFLSQHQCIEGSHIRGLAEGLLIACRRVRKEVAVTTWRELLAPSLAVAVHVGLYAPSFGDPTRSRLLNPSARRAVREVITTGLRYDPRFTEVVTHALEAATPSKH